MDDELTPASEPTPRSTEWTDVWRRPRVRLGAIIAVAVAGGLIAWVIIGRDSSSAPSKTSVSPIPPVALSASGLATLAHSVSQPIYWAGPKKGYLYEMHRTADGNIYIRYLPPGVGVGANGAKYLTVATYPFPSAYRALKNVKEGEHISIPGGGTALIGTTYKKSIHLAYPNVDYQVEVFDPSAARVLAVVKSGQIRPA